MKKFFEMMDEKTKKMFILVLVGIGVFIAIFVIISIVRTVSGGKVSYERLTEIMENSAKKYCEKENKLPKKDKSIKINVSTLSRDGYMKEIDKYNDDNCSGYVIVSNNNGEYIYLPALKCRDYKSQSLSNAIKDAKVSSGDGVYSNNSEYIYKGEYVDNYVEFAEQTWRIVKLDKDGNVQLVNDDNESSKYSWDDRYNSDVKEETGINDYSLSRIRETMKSIYEKEKRFEKNDRKFIMAHDWCIDKLNPDSKVIKNVGCTATTTDYMGLVSPYEYVSASLDDKCTSYDSKACGNYNYLNKILNSTWTMHASSKNTTDVLTYKSSIVDIEPANEYNYISLSFYMNGEVIITKGTGAKNDPYVIKTK